MSVSVGSVLGGGSSLVQQLVADGGKIRSQVDTLTDQASSGLIARSYAGLGEGAATALSLNPQVASLQTWQTNIDQATGMMTVTQTAMTQIQSIAATFLADTAKLSQTYPTEIDSVAADARSALQQLAGLLDTKYGDVYVFAGQDSANPPVPNPDGILSSGFYTQINTAVTSLSANGAAATAASTLAVASSNASGTSPFSAYLSQAAASLSAPVVQVGAQQTVAYGMLASANSAAVSTGSSTTGSYIRDLMRGLATLGSLSSSQVNDAGFADLVEDTRSSLSGAVTAMATDAGVMGDRQTSLTTIQTQLADTQTALTGQISNVQDVDMAKVLSELTQTNTRLQASYQLLSTESSLTLVKFLSS
ncbi:flagellin [Rhodopila sp.]|jgi:flagellin-like hook-associated protein FlgL|uniref:flagellin N-terminal helical domain-containing protein n=1 Tax=Rhodopila sp. TaxID=2480087 RepID=UPI002BE0A5B8|nr:flagellin [Rhodopila sp.]HVZ08741.1 flagellin [Rhodopila sp.]